MSLAGLGALTQQRGDLETARSFCEESFAIARELRETRLLARSAVMLALTAHAQGDDAKARACLTEGLKLWREMGDHGAIAGCLERLAEIAGVRGEGRRAARLLGAAAARRERLASSRAPAHPQ